MANKIITPEFRGSFVHLDRPSTMKGQPDSEPRYQMLCAFDADDEFWDIMEDAVEQAAKEKFGKVPPKFKSPIKDGDDEEYDNLKGCLYFNASNSRKPGVVDQGMSPVIDPEELYSGAWYRASVNVWAWEHPTGGKGASVSLNNVMKIKNDQRYDGGTAAQDDFAGFAKKGESGESGGRKKRRRGSSDDDDNSVLD